MDTLLTPKRKMLIFVLFAVMQYIIMFIYQLNSVSNVLLISKTGKNNESFQSVY